MKHTTRLFMALFVFFIVVAIGALGMLSGTGSVFNRTHKTPGSETAVMSQTIIGDDAVSALSVPDDFDESEVEEEKPESPKETEDSLEEVATGTGEGEDSGVNDAAATSEESIREKRYFTFITGTKYNVLRLREGPSEEAEILHKLNKNTPGYVLQPGNTWSKVVTVNGSIGYCATEYLNMTEVTAEEFPQEYLGMVEAPEEELNY